MKNGKEKKICLFGHIGIGHVHSHSGFVQDDGAGFYVCAQILKEYFYVDLTIKEISVNLEESIIKVLTNGGGVGEVKVPSGITPWEKDIIENIKNEDGLYSQRIVLKYFGRFYGQGASEVPVSLQSALALSVIDTFYKNYKEKFILYDEDIEENNGKILGTIIKEKDFDLGVILTVNSTIGGLGPIEDLEGNIFLGNKGKLIKDLKSENCPSIIIESKNYSPNLSDRLENESFLVRANKNFDNISIGNALVKGAEKENIRCIFDTEALDRKKDGLKNQTIALSKKIEEISKNLEKSESSKDKVKLIYELNKLARQEAGGVTFMSNTLNDSVGGAGMIRGISAVLSLVVTKDYIKKYKIPFVEEEDVEKYKRIVKSSLPIIIENYEEISKELEEKFDFKNH